MAARPDAHDLFHLLGGIDQELHGLNSQYCGRIGNGCAPLGRRWLSAAYGGRCGQLRRQAVPDILTQR